MYQYTIYMRGMSVGLRFNVNPSASLSMATR